jgi:integrase
MTKTQKKPRRPRGTGSLYLVGRVWWCKFYANGKPQRKSTGQTEESKAAKVLKKHIADVTVGRFVMDADKVTVGDLFTMLAADYRKKANRSRLKLTHLCDWFNVAVNQDEGTGEVTYSGGPKAVAVTKAHVDRYETARLKQVSRSTVNNELGMLRRAFRLAIDDELLSKMPKIKTPDPQNVREAFFTVEQLDHLLTLLPEYLKAPVQFAALSGWRAENVFALVWDYVDFGRGCVRMPFGLTKNGDPIICPFSHGSALEALLRERERQRDGQFVFHRRCRQIKSYMGAWKAAMKKMGPAGYGAQYDPATHTSRRVRKRFHDLRHTFAQHMTDAGAQDREILDLGGWKTHAMLKRYRIASDDRMRAALEQRDRYVEAEREKAASILPLTAKAG